VASLTDVMGRNARPRDRRRGPVIALLAITLALLTWVILWKLEVPWAGSGGLRSVILVPFGDGPRAPLELAANLLLFMPVGLYLGMLAPAWRWWRIALLAAGLSLMLELAQYALAVGTSDVTDILVNTAGALLGLGLWRFARRRLGDRAVPILVRGCAVVTVIAVLACLAFAISPLSYAQREPTALQHASH